MNIEVIKKWKVDGKEYENANKILQLLIENLIDDLASDVAGGESFVADEIGAARTALVKYGKVMGDLYNLMEESEDDCMTINELEYLIDDFINVISGNLIGTKFYDKYSKLCSDISQMWEGEW